MDLTDLTIKAMADTAESDSDNQPQVKQAATLRPVHTPLNMQIEEHARQVRTKRVKMAAGGEGMKNVIDINFDLLKSNGEKVLKLFDE